MTKVKLLVLCLCWSAVAAAQPGKSRNSITANLSQPEELMRKGNYFEALSWLKKIVEKNEKSNAAHWKLAECASILHDYRTAAQQYKHIYEQTDTEVRLAYPYAGFFYGKMLKHLGNYETARGVFMRFIDANQMNGDPQTAHYITLAKAEREGCDLEINGYSNVKAEAINMKNANGVYNEGGANFTNDDRMLYAGVKSNQGIALSNQSKSFAQLYEAERKGEEWNRLQPLAESINLSNVHNANPVLSPDGKRLYFTRSTLKNGKMVSEIYMSNVNQGVYSVPTRLEDDLNSAGTSNTTPFILDAGRGDDLIYFASNRTGGKGGYDIWRVIRHPEGTYERFENMASINTLGDELSPFIDGETKFYFSSDGHAGFGGLDVFSYEVIEQEPIIKNLGKPINSAADDFNFVTNKTGLEGFVVSNRVGSAVIFPEIPNGSDDIYWLKIDRKKPIKLADTPIVDNTPPTTTTQKVIVDGVEKTNAVTKIDGRTAANGNVDINIDIDIKNQDGQKVEGVLADGQTDTKTIANATIPKNTDENELKNIEKDTKTIANATIPKNTDENELKNIEKDTKTIADNTKINKSEDIKPKTDPNAPRISGANYTNKNRNSVSADACAKATLYDVSNGAAKVVKEIPCANENNTDFALAPNKRYIFALEKGGELLQQREVSTLGSRRSEIFHPRLDNREISAELPKSNATVTTNPAVAAQQGEKFELKGNIKPSEASADDLKGTEVVLYKMESDTKVAEVARKPLSPDNSYSFQVEHGTPYRIVAEKSGYLTVSQEFTANKTEPVMPTNDKMIMRAKKSNTAYTVKDINYDFGSVILSPESMQNLDGMITLLTDNPTIIVEISAHTDNIGTPESNLALSQKRAQAVVDYLVSKKIDKERLKAKGYGEAKPIATNFNEAGRSKNRRTEFKLIGELK